MIIIIIIIIIHHDTLTDVLSASQRLEYDANISTLTLTGVRTSDSRTQLRSIIELWLQGSIISEID